MRKYSVYLYALVTVAVFIFLSCKKEKETPQPEPPPPPAVPVGLPTVVTNPYSDFTSYSINITGSVTDSGKSAVIEAGFVVDTVESATIGKNLNKFVRVPDQNGRMQVIITEIPANTTYYLRAYAKNKQGVAYGNEITFTTKPEIVFQGDVTLANQQQVIDFGSKKYTRITGGLQIYGSVTDLSPIKGLAIIGSALVIRQTQLTTLRGLDSLESANTSAISFQGIRIEYNPLLKDLIGLNRLRGNKGYLYVLHNDGLTDLTGLDNISYNHFGEVRIENCDNIRSLHGLEKLAWLDGDIMLKDNPVLTDITAFGSMSFMTGRIRIMNNPLLQNTNGFEKLRKVDGVELYDNALLTNLNGFSNIDTIISFLLVKNTPITDLSVFKDITSIESIEIRDCPALISLNGLNSLKTIRDAMTIWNTGITNFQGLNNLASVRYMMIVYNENLQDFQGLDSLNSVSPTNGVLTISRNNQLKSLRGLERLKQAPNQISFQFNPLLNNFCGIKPLLQNGWTGYLSVQGNALNPTTAYIMSNCP